MTCHPRAHVAEQDAPGCVPGPCYLSRAGEQAAVIPACGGHQGSFNDALSQELKWYRGLEGGPSARVVTGRTS